MNFALLGFFFGFVATASAQPIINDHDLSGGARGSEFSHFSGNLIKPDSIEDGASTGKLSIQFVRRVKGVDVPVEGLSFQSYRSDANGMITDKKCKKPTLDVTISLRAERYSVGPGPSDYRLVLSLKCGVFQKVVFEEKSENAQPIAIWQVATQAEKKLSQAIDIRFWRTPIQFVWPARGDYYSGGRVNLTLGYQWDVVAHEMGHAIYDLANIGKMEGGEHYIDRCYTPTLALSEGWASFFSAWVNLDLADPDARFEYMVPRRAPIGVENVPSDVCGKSTNEWRVFAFLWDLIDTHDDGETFAQPFARLWNDTIGARASSLNEVKQRLVQKGWDSDTLQTIWKLNFPAESARF